MEGVDDVEAGSFKLDGGKPPIFRAILRGFPRAISEVAALGDFGARQHAWDGWKFLPDGRARLSDALLRHLTAEAKGETVDPTTGFTHSTAAAWNALARLELELMEK